MEAQLHLTNLYEVIEFRLICHIGQIGGYQRQTDRQTSFIEITIGAGILRSGKGAIHASAGLRAVLVFFAEYQNGISASSPRMQLTQYLSTSLVSLSFSRLFSIEIEGVAQLTQVLLRPSWAKFLHWVHKSLSRALGACRRFQEGSCRGSLVSKVCVMSGLSSGN